MLKLKLQRQSETLAKLQETMVEFTRTLFYAESWWCHGNARIQESIFWFSQVQAKLFYLKRKVTALTDFGGFISLDI